MHDLRWDQHDAAVTHVVHVLPAESLRTVPMPELRSADARTLDAARRGLDCRTADDKLVAELVRLVDALQALTLRVELLEGVIVALAERAGVGG